MYVNAHTLFTLDVMIISLPILCIYFYITFIIIWRKDLLEWLSQIMYNMKKGIIIEKKILFFLRKRM